MAATKLELPRNIEAEKAVLGLMLTSKEAFITGIGVLETPEYFYGKDSPNRFVYTAMMNLQENMTPVDVQTVTNELINMKAIDNVGGTEYLLELAESAITESNFQFYLNSVKDNFLLRKYLNCIDGVLKDYQGKKISSISDFIGESEAKLREVSQERSVSEFRTAKAVTTSVRESLSIKCENGLNGITSGYEIIDKYTLGFKKKDYIIVAARPSIGKTALCINMAYNACKVSKAPVCIFSLEMPAEMLIKRLLAARSKVNLTKIVLGDVADYKVQIDRAANDLSSTQLFIDDTPNMKLMDIVTKARKMKNEHNDLSLIVIDYIGLISVSDNKKMESRQQEVSYISRTLKQLAREIDTPIICLCQLSRGYEKSGTSKPQLSDLRESGAIEQDADIVMLLYKEDMTAVSKRFVNKKGGQMDDNDKLAASRAVAMKELMESIGGHAEFLSINIAKNRNGSTGDAYLHFLKDYGLFVAPSDEFMKKVENIRNLSSEQLNEIRHN